MRRLKIVVVLLAALLTSGCVWRLPEEERQMPARSYIRPTGATAGVTVELQGPRKYSFGIEENRRGNASRYGVEPGTYIVTIRRGDKTVLHRKIFVADGETREIPIR